MPDLPIVGSNGKLHSFAPLVVLAVTTYPEDSDKQEELIASRFISSLLPLKNSAKLIHQAVAEIPWLVPALHRGPRPVELLRTAGRDGALSWAAGELLLTMLTAAVCHPELDISLTKAVYGLSRFTNGKPTYGGGKAKSAQRTLWKAWRRFRRVAHFCAVQQLWTQNNPERHDFGLWSVSNFEEYLSVAEAIRREAVTRRFLSEETTWRVPQLLRLRSIELDLGEGFKPEFLKILHSYRPEYSKGE
jgi:hypothetical protein